MREIGDLGFDRLRRFSWRPSGRRVADVAQGTRGAKRRRVSALLALMACLVLTSSQSISSAAPAIQQSRDLTVLVGAGRDTDDIFAYFPQTIRIRAGESVTWKQNSDSTHTISFGTDGFSGPAIGSTSLAPGQTIPSPTLPIAGRPGITQTNPLQYYPFMSPEIVDNTYNGVGFASSGRLLGVPPGPNLAPIETFSLTFDTPGVYTYRCLLHRDRMYGSVEVVDPSTADVPSQADVDARAQAEMNVLTALLPAAHAQNAQARKDAGPSGTTMWTVQAGNNLTGGDLRVAVVDFMPKNVTIAAGDTVLWTSPFDFHTVSFFPAPPVPANNVAETAPDGTIMIVTNPAANDPFKPAAVFDPRQVFSSGRIGYDRPAGNTWSLIFDTPGVYDYVCAIHVERGMKGTITVLPRA
ncbi:MAG: hypothetical protein QOF51_389 [Chloroflexota bacterium]|jgi:plastocyanin|nr:hypothetical protein [Chloroflexota bacterium]